MSATSIPKKGERGSRVKLGGSVLGLLLLENGRQIRARMSQLSLHGGLVSLAHPLDEGIRVTVVFHVGCTSIRCRARTMFPMWATRGCLQPLSFVDLDEASRISLSSELEKMVRAGESPDKK